MTGASKSQPERYQAGSIPAQVITDTDTNQLNETRPTMSALTEKYLGDQNVMDFFDEADIVGYFCEDNLMSMFPGEDFDQAEIDQALAEVLKAFEAGIAFDDAMSSFCQF